MISGFFNSVNGDRRYSSDFFARFLASIVGNGVYINPSTNFQVVEKENMTTTLRPGRIWIQGWFGYDDFNYNIDHDVADGVLNRIDRVVARLDSLERDIIIQVKKGKSASDPVAPTLQRDADAWELALADVRINAGTTYITQANITDLRLNDELCGIVHGAVDQVEVSEIFEQYQSWFNQTTEKSEQDFLDWFDHLKDTLEGDVATALYLEIERAEKRAQEYTNTAPEPMLQNMNRFETDKINKDNRGNFHIVEKKRNDGTLFEKSVMSVLNEENNPTVRTITTYEEDGTTVIQKVVFDLYYDEDDDFVREVPRL